MAGAQTEHGYKRWLGSDDAHRIEGQNAADWGKGQREYLLKLKASGLKPKRMAELGVAPDATLVLNALEVFGDSLDELVVFELDQERLDGARRTIEERLKDKKELAAKVSYVQGDAGQTLSTYGEESGNAFDFIHGQLILEHLLPEERRTVLQRAAHALGSEGIFTVADVAFGDWYNRANPSDNKDGQTIAAQDNAAIRVIRRRWSAVGKTDFETPKALAEVVTRDSRRTDDSPILELLPGLSTISMVDDFQPGSPEMSFMLGMLGRLHADPEHPMPEDKAIEAAIYRYSIDLPNSAHPIARVYPSLVRQSFRKIA